MICLLQIWVYLWYVGGSGSEKWIFSTVVYSSPCIVITVKLVLLGVWRYSIRSSLFWSIYLFDKQWIDDDINLLSMSRFLFVRESKYINIENRNRKNKELPLLIDSQGTVHYVWYNLLPRSVLPRILNIKLKQNAE